MADFNKDLCDEKHANEDRRITALENVIPRIFETLDKYKQRPTWITTTVISLLTASTVGLLVAMVKGGH
jgi:hypothetical protein